MSRIPLVRSLKRRARADHLRREFGIVPATILKPNRLRVEASNQNNYVDQIIDAKLRRLKIQPTPEGDDATFLRRVALDLSGQPPTLLKPGPFSPLPNRAAVRNNTAMTRIDDSLRLFIDSFGYTTKPPFAALPTC